MLCVFLYSWNTGTRIQKGLRFRTAAEWWAAASDRSCPENSCCRLACRDEAQGSHLAAEVGFDNLRNRLETEGVDSTELSEGCLQYELDFNSRCTRMVLHLVAAGCTGGHCSLEAGMVEANLKEDMRFDYSPDYSLGEDMVAEIVREDSQHSHHVAEPARRQNFASVHYMLPKPKDLWSTSRESLS